MSETLHAALGSIVFPTDRFIEISGTDAAVRAALTVLTMRLDYRANPPIAVGGSPASHRRPGREGGILQGEEGEGPAATPSRLPRRGTRRAAGATTLTAAAAAAAATTTGVPRPAAAAAATRFA